MSKWLGKRIRSISIGGPGALRFMNNTENSQEAKKFHELVRDLDDGESPEECVAFFIQHFGSFEYLQLNTLHISKETTTLIQDYIPYLMANLNNQSAVMMGLSFLQSAITIYVPEPKSNQSILDFIIGVLNTDALQILNQAMKFIQTSTLVKPIQSLFLVGENLELLWYACYVKNPTTCKIYGQFFIEMYDGLVFKLLDKLKPFLNAVIISFKNAQICKATASNAVKFLCTIISKINTGPFLTNFFPVAASFFTLLDDLECFHVFFNAPTQDTIAVWNGFNKVCSTKDIPIYLLESALNVVSTKLDSPYLFKFSFKPFYKRAKELSSQSQVLLFKIVAKFPIETKKGFFMKSIPTWKTGIESSLLCSFIINNDWGDYIGTMISEFVNIDFPKFSTEINCDPSLVTITDFLIQRIHSKAELSPFLFQSFIIMANDNVPLACLGVEKLLETQEIESYMESLIVCIAQQIICDKVFKMLSKHALKSHKFVDQFLINNGMYVLLDAIKSLDGVDFLASLASNGPYSQIDNLIKDNFDSSYLAQLSEHQLYNLMMGLAQDSNATGVLRIPSLCPHVSTITFKTQFDRYIYGYYGNQYYKPREDLIPKYAAAFLDNNNAQILIKDAKILYHLTNTDVFHFPVFQLHQDVPNAHAKFKLQTSSTFWVYIDEYTAPTVLIKTAIGSITIYDNILSIFGHEPIDFLFHKWHMITILAIPKAFQCNLVFYLDMVKVGDFENVPSKTITIGDEKRVNGVFYLSGSIQTSSSMITNADLKSMFQNGPKAFCPTKISMRPGFVFIPYKGILSYLDHFGGKEFIFIQLLRTNDKEEFKYLLQTSFNLLHLDFIDEDFFFPALRYVLSMKKDINDTQIESIILHELQVNPNKTWTHTIRLLCDHRILTLPYITLDFMTQILDRDEDSSHILYFIIDAFVAFNTNKTIESNLYLSIKYFVAANPFLLRLILLIITALSHLETNEIVPIEDEDAVRKQNMLFNIVIENFHMFPQNVAFEKALRCVSTLREDQALELLQMMAKICIIDPNYFDIESFKYHFLFFASNVTHEKMWISLFTFLTGNHADSIEDFSDVVIQRPQLVPSVLNLIIYLMRIEIPNNKHNPVCFRSLITLVKLASASNINLADYPTKIQKLCALGFDQQPQQPTPFSLDQNEEIMKESSPPLLSEKYEFRFTRIHALNASMYEETVEYLKKSTSKMVFEPENLPQNELAQLPPNFCDIMKSNAIIVISRLAASTVVSKSKEMLNRKLLVSMVINGADVHPKIAEIMHRRIILEILKWPIKLDEEPYEQLIQFIINRVVEGWWEEELLELFNEVIKRKCKLTKSFIIACLIKCHNSHDLILMLMELVDSLFYEYSTKDSNFYHAFIHIFTKNEVMSDPSYSILKAEILTKIQPCEFTQAIENNTISSWSSQQPIFEQKFHEFNSELIKNAQASSKMLKALRIEVTSSNIHNIINIYKYYKLVDASFIRRAYKFQLYNRLNQTNADIERAISRIYQKQTKLKAAFNIPDKFMVIPSSHPLSVPQKVIPLSFIYEIPQKSSTISLVIPQSIHSSQYQSKLTELNSEEPGPKCLEGWNLPSYVDVGLSSLLSSYFSATYQLFSINLLASPELLPCVATYNPESICILMNANLKNGELKLNDTSDMLCQFAVFESASQGIIGKASIFAHHPTLVIKFRHIILAIPRKYVYHELEVDLYTIHGDHFTIVFSDTQERKLFLSKIKNTTLEPSPNSPSFSSYLLSLSQEKVTKMWVNQSITTYDYLLYLNTVSGRSFNDYAQYPVFPWILGDYKQDQPVLKRDLSKPMGAQTPERAERYLISFREAEPHCHYGTHYSNPAAVFHFMLRIEPFTFYNVFLHNGMDHRDRQFSNISDSWRSASEANQADLKELIPEFYSNPMIFENPNNIDFSTRTDGTSLNTVGLPKWAKDPLRFVWRMRATLECEEANRNIGKWIDLIFGYKQRGQAAIEAQNVFQPLSYDDVFDGIDFQPSINKAAIDAINQFGQCPAQLFMTPHPECAKKHPTTLLNSKIIITTSFMEFSPNSDTINISQKLFPHSTPVFEHYLRGQNLKVWNNYIEFNHLRIESVDACTCTCTSKDNMLLAVFSKYGIANIYSCVSLVPEKISTIISPSFDVNSCAISTQHYLLCASSSDSLLLFDITTGYFIRRINAKEQINKIEFDDKSNFIVAVSEKHIYVYQLDFKLVAQATSQVEITALTTGNSPIWLERPIYVTGHINGIVNIWELDVLEGKLSATKLMQKSSSPISAVLLFSNDRAALAIDVEGCASLASVSKIGTQFLHHGCFTKCCNCEQPLTNMVSRCSSCGLYYCRNCLPAKRPLTCVQCSKLMSVESQIRFHDLAEEEEESSGAGEEEAQQGKIEEEEEEEKKTTEEEDHEAEEEEGETQHIMYREASATRILTRMAVVPTSWRHSI